LTVLVEECALPDIHIMVIDPVKGGTTLGRLYENLPKPVEHASFGLGSFVGEAKETGKKEKEEQHTTHCSIIPQAQDTRTAGRRLRGKVLDHSR
jgi:hypothetical protein